MWCEERIVGLTLIHGNNQPDTKPRVFVVAENSVHAALSSDLELDVYPECFDYDSFVKASLSKSISTNGAIVLVSDALSQRVAPLEAVIALVRSNVILIPWKSSEAEIAQLNVAACSPRPTPNTLRRTIFQHVGMHDLPPRFDGDEYIDEPPDAHVMNFSPQSTQEVSHEFISEEHITPDRSISPIDWFSSEDQAEAPTPTLRDQIYHDTDRETPELNMDFLPPADRQKIEEENTINEEMVTEDIIDDEVFKEEIIEAQAVVEQESAPTNTVAIQSDEPSFLPEFFSPQSQPEQDMKVRDSVAYATPPQENPLEKEAPSETIDTFWGDEPSEKSARTNDEQATAAWVASTFGASTDEKTMESSENTTGDWSSKPTTPTSSTPAMHPYAATNPMDLDTYNDTGEVEAYEVDESSPSTFIPEVAFAPTDKSGSPDMWSMFDTNADHSSAQNQASLSEFPDGSDHRKAITLAEPLVLCVYSPKGGVGKTSISVNLAARLAYTTRLQVCIVDLDIAFGNVGTRLGLYNPTVRELLNEPHIDGESIARNLVYDRRSGLFALLAPLRPETGVNRRKFSPAAYKKILSLLKERFDVVILDCPVELRDPLVSGFALTEAAQVVMVVNNEQATLLDARRAVEAMCRPKDSQRLPGLGLDPHSVGMVVNQKVENVGREVEDIRAILGGGDPNHPSREIEILSVIADDRQLWVGNANMARTVATSGENDVDKLLDDIWTKILPDEAANEFESQQFNASYSNPLDEILSRSSTNEPKKKRKFNIFKSDNS